MKDNYLRFYDSHFMTRTIRRNVGKEEQRMPDDFD